MGKNCYFWDPENQESIGVSFQDYLKRRKEWPNYFDLQLTIEAKEQLQALEHPFISPVLEELLQPVIDIEIILNGGLAHCSD